MDRAKIEKKIEEAIINVLNKLKEKEDSYIYNEISLQNELGIELRKKFEGTEQTKVFFEKNVKSLYKKECKENEMVKKEMDLFICDGSKVDEGKKEAYAIELKFVKRENNRVPENLYDFVKDMRFMEQIKENAKEYRTKIITTYVLTIVDDAIYVESKNKNTIGIYQYFRNNKDDNNEKSLINISKETIIVKPTKNSKNSDEHEEMLNIIKDEQSEESKQQSLKKIIENANELKAGVIYIKLNNDWNLEWQKIKDTNYYAYCGKVTGNKDKGYKVNKVNLTTSRKY